MTKGVILSNLAQARLVEIQSWSLSRWGAKRTGTYMDDMLDRIDALAAGELQGRSARRLIDATAAADLMILGVASHYAIYTETDENIVVLDICHEKQNLAALIDQLFD